MHWYSTFSRLCLLGYLPRWVFWLFVFLNICAFWVWGVGLRTSDELTHKSSHFFSCTLALKCLNWQTLTWVQFKHRYQHVLFRSHMCAHAISTRVMTAHIPAYGTRIEQEWMVCRRIFPFAVVVMYWEARMRIHQQKHTLAEPCLFCMLFITNHIQGSRLTFCTGAPFFLRCTQIFI